MSSLAVKVLAIAGSLRADSFNKKLLKIAAAAARDAGAEVTIADLCDFPMPLYDGDQEAKSGLPEPARRLKRMFIEHNALLVASPEYNSSVSGALKNAIDWVSRPEPSEPGLVAFDGKVAGIMAASTGALGGLRGLVHLRAILGNIKVLVIPEQTAVPQAQQAFDESGMLKDAKQKGAVEGIARKVVDLSRRLRA